MQKRHFTFALKIGNFSHVPSHLGFWPSPTYTLQSVLWVIVWGAFTNGKVGLSQFFWGHAILASMVIGQVFSNAKKPFKIFSYFFKLIVGHTMALVNTSWCEAFTFTQFSTLIAWCGSLVHTPLSPSHVLMFSHVFVRCRALYFLEGIAGSSQAPSLYCSVKTNAFICYLACVPSLAFCWCIS